MCEIRSFVCGVCQWIMSSGSKPRESASAKSTPQAVAPSRGHARPARVFILHPFSPPCRPKPPFSHDRPAFRHDRFPFGHDRTAGGRDHLPTGQERPPPFQEQASGGKIVARPFVPPFQGWGYTLPRELHLPRQVSMRTSQARALRFPPAAHSPAQADDYFAFNFASMRSRTILARLKYP